MNIIKQIENSIKQVMKNSLKSCIEKQLLPDIKVTEINIEKPREKEHGSFSCNLAMIIVKQARMSPKKISELLIEQIDFNGTHIERAVSAGPGFINFFLKSDWLYDNTRYILANQKTYGKSDYGKMQKVNVEYVSANPTGPLHMGNARGGALGDLIANVLDKAGYDVYKEFYINDAGNQIDRFGKSLEARYLQEKLGEKQVEFPEDGYQGIDIINHVKEYIKNETTDLQTVDEKLRQKTLVEYALPKNITAIKKGLARYGITYDQWFTEQSLYDSGAVDKMITYLIDKGHTSEYDDALWLKGTAMNSEKDEVLKRSNGYPTYFAADLAYHYNKFYERKFDRAINLLGADHHGHAIRMEGAMEAIGIKKEKLDIVLFQLVRLLRDGCVAKMSKRTGTAISLDDLLDEVGVDAARFFFNMKQSGSHLDFDLDLAKKQTNENPVFYVQYAHARICSMLRILEEDGVKINNEEKLDFSLLVEKEEILLMEKLAEYPNEIVISANTLEPSRMTRYVHDVAALFHSFYNACRVRGIESKLQQQRINLVKATKVVLQNSLELLSITAPEKM